MEKIKSKTIPLSLNLTPPNGCPSTINLNYQPLSDAEIQDLVSVARDRLYTKETVRSRPKAHNRLTLVSNKSLELPLMNLICGTRVIAMMEEVIHLRAALAHVEQQARANKEQSPRGLAHLILYKFDEDLLEEAYPDMPANVDGLFEDVYGFAMPYDHLSHVQSLLEVTAFGTPRTIGEWIVYPTSQYDAVLGVELQFIMFNSTLDRTDFFVLSTSELGVKFLLDRLKLRLLIAGKIPSYPKKGKKIVEDADDADDE